MRPNRNKKETEQEKEATPIATDGDDDVTAHLHNADAPSGQKRLPIGILPDSVRPWPIRSEISVRFFCCFFYFRSVPKVHRATSPLRSIEVGAITPRSAALQQWRTKINGCVSTFSLLFFFLLLLLLFLYPQIWADRETVFSEQRPRDLDPVQRDRKVQRLTNHGRHLLVLWLIAAPSCQQPIGSLV